MTKDFNNMNNEKMEEQFKAYLKNQGYSQKTPSGNPSTVDDYAHRIHYVCKQEDMTWMELVENIARILNDYDTHGRKEDLGNRSHRAVINALKRFSEFLNL